MVPEGWSQERLDKHALHITSGSRGWAEYYADQGDVFVRITNLRRECIEPDWANTKYVSLPEGMKEGLRTRLKAGDILVSITADLGVIGYISDEPPVPHYINQHVALVRLKGELVDPKFVAYSLASTEMSNTIQRLNDAGAKAGLSLPTIRGIPVMLPPYAEQKKIAEILSTWDRAIEVAEAQLECARTQKRALMQHLLTGRRRFPEFEGQEWKEVRLGDVIASMDAGVSVNSGDKPARAADFGILKTSSVSQGVFDPSENKIVDAEEEIVRLKEPVSAGTTIMSRMNTPALVGANGYVPCDMPKLFLPDRLWAIRANPSVAFPAWVGHLLASGSFRYKLSSLATGTSGSMKNITKSDVRAIVIKLPPIEEQKRIAQVLDDAASEIDQLIRVISKLRTEKKALMQQLLTGKRRVSV